LEKLLGATKQKSKKFFKKNETNETFIEQLK